MKGLDELVQRMLRWCLCGLAMLGAAGLGLTLRAQVPSPVSFVGHTPGDDFYLASYEEAVKYFHAMAAGSDRMKMFTVGKTTQGREIGGVVSSPGNLARLDEWKRNAKLLATPEGLDDAAAHRLARETKAIVHIDRGLHSSEVAGGQHSIALAYKRMWWRRLRTARQMGGGRIFGC